MTFGALARKAGAAAGVALGAGAMVMCTAAPSSAADNNGSQLPPLQAAATSLNAEIAGKSTNSVFKAVFDGTEMVTSGVNAPVSPMIAGQELISAGALSQDAIANAQGAAACAALVGPGGKINVGADGSCMVNPGGEVAISLGTLPQLGTSGLLSKLPELDLPVDLPLGGLSADSLPDAELRLVGDAVSAQCMLTPNGSQARANVGNMQLMAVVDGEQIALGNINANSEGVSLSLQSLVGQLAGSGALDQDALLGKLDEVLAKLPADELPTGNLIDIKVNETSDAAGTTSATALHVKVGAPALPADTAGTLPELPEAVDVQIGHAECGSGNAPMGSTKGALPTEALQLQETLSQLTSFLGGLEGLNGVGGLGNRQGA